MPPESAQHEATIMAWPCRAELWEDLMTSAKAEYGAVANAIAEFEPVIMVASSSADAAEARAALSGRVEVVEIPLDDSWMRDNGPVFCLDDQGRRAGVHFGFNAWGGKYAGWDRDEQAGGVLAERYGDRVYDAPVVLEGGSVIIDSAGRLVTTEQCLLHPNRNPDLSRADIESVLRDYLGVVEIVWLARGLVEDRDTDGHVDLIAAFTDSGSLLLQARPPGDPNHESMAENRDRAAAGRLGRRRLRPAGPRRGGGPSRRPLLPEPLSVQRRRDRPPGRWRKPGRRRAGSRPARQSVSPTARLSVWPGSPWPSGAEGRTASRSRSRPGGARREGHNRIPRPLLRPSAPYESSASAGRGGAAPLASATPKSTAPPWKRA